MILTKTPLRLTLGGGGTDAPEWVSQYGGYAITAAIDKHIYVGINDMFDDGYRLVYSHIEHVATIDEIQHPIIREAFRFYDVPPHVEIVTLADIPAGTGLGSSGAFGVGLVEALRAYNGLQSIRSIDADVACQIELDILQRPGGKQDPWACALGGIQGLFFARNDVVYPSKIVDGGIEDKLALFFTGFSRDADTILATQTTEGLKEIQDGVGAAMAAIEQGNAQALGELMHEHWLTKRKRSTGISNPRIDSVYELARKNGAIGGKLVGAGGGGFLLFVTEDPNRLEAALELQRVPFKFEYEGAVIL